MIIQIHSYGVSISTKDGCFLFSGNETKRKISAHKVSAIHVYKPCTVTTPVLQLAAEKDVAFLVFNNSGQVVSKVWEPFFGSTSAIRHAQLQWKGKNMNALVLKNWLILKSQEQSNLLSILSRRVKSSSEELSTIIDSINGRNGAFLKSNSDLSDLRSYDAIISRMYFKGIQLAMKNYLPFKKRSRQPALDEFNSLLNYGYGMLYAMVESSLHSAGLDPHISILHREDYDTPALVYDAIEPFRPWVDKWVCMMALGKKVQSSYFDGKEDGFWLSDHGKKEVIPDFYRNFDERAYFNGRRLVRRDHIHQLAMDYVRVLIKNKGG